MTSMRIGQGFDVHPFDRDGTRSLVLGGVVFEGAPGFADTATPTWSRMR